MSKLRLEIDRISVESFATARVTRRIGTVRGHGDDCTWADSCFCHTAYAVCGTGHATIHSCTYTFDERCNRETEADACVGTEWEVCGTGTPPQLTPAC
jgi:hypothetical protein